MSEHRVENLPASFCAAATADGVAFSLEGTRPATQEEWRRTFLPTVLKLAVLKPSLVLAWLSGFVPEGAGDERGPLIAALAWLVFIAAGVAVVVGLWWVLVFCYSAAALYAAIREVKKRRFDALQDTRIRIEVGLRGLTWEGKEVTWSQVEALSTVDWPGYGPSVHLTRSDGQINVASFAHHWGDDGARLHATVRQLWESFGEADADEAAARIALSEVQAAEAR